MPPNTNPDDTLPGFALSTFYEAYLGYKAHDWDGSVGEHLFTSPWADPADSRLKPEAFQGADVGYTSPANWTFEGADMMPFENRTSSTFQRQTLLTSYPAGNSGLAVQHLRARRLRSSKPTGSSTGKPDTPIPRPGSPPTATSTA